MGTLDTSLFSPDLVFFDIEATDSIDFFGKLHDRLAPKGYLKDTWLDAIRTRETNYPTGLELENISVAIPHVEPENIEKPYIAVAKPVRPVAFQPMAAMVDHPVQAQLVINLGLLAHDEDQVAVLQTLMNVFMDKAACEDILAQTTGEGMVNTIVKRCNEVA
ncbi:MAG: PTS sugar transporter subunit IIA [Tractidigestivibacter sp.]|jgi:PTS system galactitol-specific IIA component|uniref:PTS sugar transporter subunit IIA n=1 Tax=Tractidigestivibacter sp. TaxID=2847320 RepID=UPI003D8B5AC0